MLELSIDSKNKIIHAVVELKGEERPIALDVQYELAVNESMDGVRVRAKHAIISKEWLNLIAQELVGREFIIEGKDAAQIIQLVRNLGLV